MAASRVERVQRARMEAYRTAHFEKGMIWVEVRAHKKHRPPMSVRDLHLDGFEPSEPAIPRCVEGASDFHTAGPESKVEGRTGPGELFSD